ncbi:MAG: tetratricopeptide repeat protein [Candidatus Binataceae bacterium]
MDDPARPIIRAFVGRTFNNEQDKHLWLEIREVLDNLRGVRFSWEDAEEPQMLSVSTKIRKKIADNQIYIGILTRRKPILRERRPRLLSRLFAGKSAQHEGLWSVSPWVVQESGYALGLGRKVLFLLEEGVDFPTSDMQADAEWIRFVRSDLKALQMRLVTILVNEIGRNLPLLQEGISSEREQVPAPLVPPKEQAEQNAESSVSFGDVRKRLNEKDFAGADELFQQYTSHLPEGLQSWLKYRYLRLKAASGHQESLDQLQTIVQSETRDLEALTQLALYFQQFNKHSEAIEVLRGGLRVVEPDLRPELYRLIARVFVEDNNYDSAIDTLATLLRANKLSTDEVTATFLTLADIAQKRGDTILEASALEGALEFESTDAASRFRLAFLYSSIGQYALAAFHYKIRLAQDGNSTVKNNLAVAFGNLNLRAREVDLYSTAAGEEPLAKANLSHCYVDAGFLTSKRE